MKEKPLTKKEKEVVEKVFNKTMKQYSKAIIRLQNA